MDRRYIFTAVAGRSGQATLTEILRRHVADCLPAFEAPAPRIILGGRLGQWERRFRRRFVETHELLGRGKVLTAFERGDIAYIEKIAARRLARIHRDMTKAAVSTYFDVSKFFARGLHVGFRRRLPEIALLRLVRDPLSNMRSFLNRNKTFTLDNSLPDAPSNVLRLDSRDMTLGELYLWAWCEMYLRFDCMINDGGVSHHAELRTEDLDNPERVETALRKLGLSFTPVASVGPLNSNAGQGYGVTQVDDETVATFERFIGRLSSEMLGRIAYFADYDPDRRGREDVDTVIRSQK